MVKSVAPDLSKIRMVTDLLPVNGEPVRSKDLEKAAAATQEKPSWPTVSKRLKMALDEGVVVAEPALVNGVPAKMYALDIASALRQFGASAFSDVQQALTSLPELKLQLLQDQDRRRIILESHLEALTRLTTVALVSASEAETKAHANRLAEIVVDVVLRRWIRDLAGSVWETRRESADVLRTILADKGSGERVE